jgi:hypothetical protein
LLATAQKVFAGYRGSAQITGQFFKIDAHVASQGTDRRGGYDV